MPPATTLPPPPAGPAGAAVGGRITIDDTVFEKIAALAALEVGGVVGLTGHDGQGGHAGPDGRPAGGAAGRGTGTTADRSAADPPRSRAGVRVLVLDDEVTLDLGVVVAYGSVIMEVAEAVKGNVARVVGLMIGMRVAAVNVVVEDVRT